MDEQLPDSDGVLPNKLGITDPEELKTARSGPSTYPRATPHSAGQPSLVPRNTDSSTSYVTNASCASELNAIHPFFIHYLTTAKHTW
jgi:fido (protein-threonine AMPylation protein)